MIPWCFVYIPIFRFDVIVWACLYREKWNWTNTHGSLSIKAGSKSRDVDLASHFRFLYMINLSLYLLYMAYICLNDPFYFAGVLCFVFLCFMVVSFCFYSEDI